VLHVLKAALLSWQPNHSRAWSKQGQQQQQRRLQVCFGTQKLCTNQGRAAHQQLLMQQALVQSAQPLAASVRLALYVPHLLQQQQQQQQQVLALQTAVSPLQVMRCRTACKHTPGRHSNGSSRSRGRFVAAGKDNMTCSRHQHSSSCCKDTQQTLSSSSSLLLLIRNWLTALRCSSHGLSSSSTSSSSSQLLKDKMQA
jgi:hypothetical protein